MDLQESNTQLIVHRGMGIPPSGAFILAEILVPESVVGITKCRGNIFM